MKNQALVQPIPQLRISTLIPFIDFFESIGSPTETFFKQVKLPIFILEKPEALVPRYQLFTLLEKAAQTEGIENLGLVVGQQTEIQNLGAFGRLIGQSLTLYDALSTIMRLIPITNSGARYSLSEQGEQAWFYQQFIQVDRCNSQYGSHFVLILLIKLIQKVAGEQWQPQEIQIQNGQALCLADIPLLSSTQIHSNQKTTGIAFPRSLLSLPFKFALNASTEQVQQDYELLYSSAPAKDFLGSIRQVISTLLPGGYPNIHLLAEISGMSIRTFQRRLIEEGVTYSHLVEQTRYETAARLLQDSNVEIVNIAFQLGYTDAAHFSRAFKRWTGISPSAFRALF